ncbi:hypothetical protein GGH96_004351 [Coemansia sp. RSA 1972]|nr:hypothetical protein GGH96_004351 [Coemansia sp. RSA 1972]
MNPTNDSVEFFNPSFGQALPATDNAVADVQPDIGFAWHEFLIGLADGGLPPFPFPGPTDTPTAQEMQRQNSEPERGLYVCHVCLREFTRPSSLTTHIRSHTGEKPYECGYPGCFKRFSVRSNMRRHEKLHVDRALRRGARSPYMVINMRTGRMFGYRRNSDPLH